MNQDSLSHIVNQNEQINADVVIDLVQLCQSFPYFSLPYVLLSKHYAFKHDFRTETTLFQAALRVSDRDWMFQYIHKTNSLLAESQNIHEIAITSNIQESVPENPISEIQIDPSESIPSEPIVEFNALPDEIQNTPEIEPVEVK